MGALTSIMQMKMLKLRESNSHGYIPGKQARFQTLA